jgi:glycosyltransferase involved in cell wall biosynthesis
MRIGIDVRYLSHGLVGGIHTYLTNLIPPLLELSHPHTVMLYADTKSDFEIETLPANVRLRRLPWRNPLSSVQNDLLEIRRHMARDAVDVAHFTASYGFGPRNARTVVTLQDEINVLPLRDIIRGHRKSARSIAMMTYLSSVTKMGLRRTDQLITVSDYSKRQIAHNAGYDPERIVVIPHACPRDITRIIDAQTLTEVRTQLGLTRPFILAEAFKNPGVIVEAWRRLDDDVRAHHEIVFFSRSPDVLPVVNEAVSAGWARLLVRPPRKEVLSALYSMAEAFVFPSWIEGFGIPLLEAMRCGAPVIASDRGSIPEVVGDAALIMDAEDAAALTHYLTTLLASPSARSHWQAKGLERSERFTWSQAAEQTLNVYERALQSTPLRNPVQPARSNFKHSRQVS